MGLYVLGGSLLAGWSGKPLYCACVTGGMTVMPPNSSAFGVVGYRLGCLLECMGLCVLRGNLFAGSTPWELLPSPYKAIMRPRHSLPLSGYASEMNCLRIMTQGIRT